MEEMRHAPVNVRTHARLDDRIVVRVIRCQHTCQNNEHMLGLTHVRKYVRIHVDMGTHVSHDARIFD